MAYLMILREMRKKSFSQTNAMRCLMLDYAKIQSQYRLWDIKRRMVIIVRDVTFNEHTLPATNDFAALFPGS